ncbi:MAG: G2-specific serine/threonine protein kinase [Sclerophora amabilis]|nr:MAG: G2-specific serine/threonine protein kinase [Sclerophora amabilis]
MSEADKYEVLEKIGHGSFGIIRKVRRKSDGHVLCRKEISYMRTAQKEREQIHAEFSILSSLRHPNIVAYYNREHLKTTQELHIYMEYCGNGDLLRIIKDLKAKNQYAEEEFVWSIFSQLVTALFRCHHGEDPPEVGKNILGAGNNAKPKAVGTKGRPMILHRDLKPENVFLGTNNSVKLGDFGLSKVLQAHDFASTYVGTPFYMSPEVCAAERYGHYSDVWSLGCIMYELCMKEPPFNAKTHVGLIQKIKEGRIAPLPNIYSVELQDVIKSCLKVNPNQRPDTTQLVNLPIVKLMRKEREVVEFSMLLKSREEAARLRIKEVEETARLKLKEVHERSLRDKEQMVREIEERLRREWEVKARLEIDQQVGAETQRLQRVFESTVEARVQSELPKRLLLPTNPTHADTKETGQAAAPESPPKPVKSLLKRTTQTPLNRSRTMFDVGVQPSPMDVSMTEASPMSLASLSLSPRRGSEAPSSLRRNVFAAAAAEKRARRVRLDLEAPSRSPPPSLLSEVELESEDENEEDPMPPPSPTRMPASRMFSRPALARAATTGNVKGRTLVELAQGRAPAVRRQPAGKTPAVWDPETEEMPSPFLARGKSRGKALF